MENPENLPPNMMQQPYFMKKDSSNALISLIAGILGWTFLPILGAICAVIFGHLAKSEIRKSNGMLTGDGMATAGLVLGYVWIGLIALAICLVIVALILFAPSWESMIEQMGPAMDYSPF